MTQTDVITLIDQGRPVDEAEYATFRAMSAIPRMINLGDLEPGERTLAYGYTTDLDSWHAYVMDEQIHVVTYSRGVLLGHRQGTSVPVEMLVPSKRVFPDTVDRKFAELMRDAGMELPFVGNFDFGSPEVVRRSLKGAFKGDTHANLT